MRIDNSSFLLVLVAVLIMAGFISFRLRPAKASRIALASIISPGLLMLVLYYSLVFHMHQSLGGLPVSSDDQGFPPSLLVHDVIALVFFGLLYILTLYVWPIAFLLCLVVRRWRASAYYLGMYALVTALCFATTAFVPGMYVHWFWD